MEEFRYDTRLSLESSRKKIDVILGAIDNGVFVFDFGHYIGKEINNQFYFKSVISGSDLYRSLLFNENRINVEPDAYSYFEGNIKQIKNIPRSLKLNQSDKETTFIPEPDIITTDIVFHTNDWIETLHQIGINGCLFVYARKVGNYQSGVWLVLKERIHELNDDLICFGFKDECITCKDSIEGICLNRKTDYFTGREHLINTVENVFHELEKLLIDELVFNAEEYAKKQESYRLSENAQKLVLEKFSKEILEAHSHTIFNCIPSLKIQNLRERLSPILEYFEKGSDDRKYVEDIDDEIKNIHVRLTELNYVTHAALESPVSKKEKLFREKTLVELIMLLKELTKNRCNPIISGLNDLNFNPVFIEKECQNAFTVLWNAWNNAVNHSINQSFKLTLNEDLEYLRIVFSNEFHGKVNEEHLKLLRSEIDPEVYSAGIPIIKHLSNSLRWKTWAEVKDDNFMLELIIKKVQI